MIRLKRIISKEPSYYLIAILLCGLFLTWAMQLWSADISIPFEYKWDATSTEASIKGMIENGWYLTNPSVGTPFGQNMADFPTNANLDMLIMKLIALIFPNWAITINLYYLLTFPLIVILTLLVLRKLKVSPLPAIAGSLLFAFMPYHFFRGENHLCLSTYYLIPLLVLMIFWIFENDFLFSRIKQVRLNSLSLLLTRRNLAAVLICIGIGSTFIYYPFFACFFLLIAGILASITAKNRKPLINSIALIGIVALCIAIWNIPALLYQYQNGANSLIDRDPAESEIYGLKIIQLLLPIMDNRNPILAAIADQYAQSSPLVNENRFAALGIIGSIGFIILVFWLFYRLFRAAPNNTNETFTKINQLSALNGAAILLGTLGGFGTLTAIFFIPQIRDYNRISIFIAFFAILTVVLLADWLIQRYSFSKMKKGAVYGCLILALCLGIYDQTSASFIPNYQETEAVYVSDDNFIKNIETKLPDKAMVFQLPYIHFPEGAFPNQMASYDHFHAYLHSETLRWSFGALRGREGDYWQDYITYNSDTDMVRGLSLAGFSGIYVDSYGYGDGGKQILDSLTSILNETPAKSDNDRLYFFDMTRYNADLKSQYTPEAYADQQLKIMNPLKIDWPTGFSELQIGTKDNWRWGKAQGELVINNTLEETRKFQLKATFKTGYSDESNLFLTSDLITDNLTINSNGYDYEKEIMVPPGEHTIRFSSNAKLLVALGVQTDIAFGMYNFKMMEE